MIENIDEYKQGDELYLVQFFPYSHVIRGIFKCKFVSSSFKEDENKKLIIVYKCKGFFQHIAIEHLEMLFETEELAIEGARKYIEDNIEYHKHALSTLKKSLRSLSNKKIIKK